MEEPSPGVQHIASLLDRLIAFQGVPVRTIERKMGVRQGYLARVFRGETYLRYQHILSILEAIDIPPLSFFKLAYDTEGGDPELKALLRKRTLPQPPEPLPATFNEAELEQVVLKTLEKLGFSKEGKTPPPPKRPPRGKKD